MKIVSVIGLRGFPGIQGGVEKHCEHIYPLMDNTIKLRVYRRKPYLTDLSHSNYPNIEYIDLPSTRIKGFEAIFHTFICVIHILFNRPDTVHIHNIGPGLFTPLLKLFRLNVILTYHSPNYEHKKWGFFAKKLLKFSESIALNFSDKIIFVNKFQMQKYNKSIQSKSYYIPNGVLKNKPSHNFDFIESYGLEPKEYILAVGRLTPEKGFEHLIEAANLTPQLKHLVIAGACDHDNTYLDRLKALDTNNKVVFTGYTDGENLRQLYSNARIFVLSSLNEGFPLVMLEAMSYNLPMVVSDIPATHLVELNISDYVEPGNVSLLANAISQKLKEKTLYQSYNMSEFDWDKVAEKTQQVY